MNYFQKVLTAGAAATALLGLSAAAQAEPITYTFEALVTQADKTELAAAGINTSSNVISGSFTYDSADGWWGGSNVQADPSMDLTINQMPSTTLTSLYLNIEYNQGVFTMHEDAYNASYTPISAAITLTNQTATAPGLPTSLTLQSGSTLALFIGNNGDTDLVAAITSLSVAGAATSTPELDPAAGAGALALLLGGMALLMTGRRRELVGAV